MATDFSGFGDLLGAQGQPHSMDAEVSLSDSVTGMSSGLVPRPQAVDGVNIGDVIPPLDPAITEIDPNQGESYPGGPPGDYGFVSLDKPDVYTNSEGWVPFRPSPIADPYAQDCDLGQDRVRVICDSGVLTRVTIYNGAVEVSTTDLIGTGQTAPPDKSYCGDFTRVKVEYTDGHGTFRIMTNKKLVARRPI